jgi:hypothetical protein
LDDRIDGHKVHFKDHLIELLAVLGQQDMATNLLRWRNKTRPASLSTNIARTCGSAVMCRFAKSLSEHVGASPLIRAKLHCAGSGGGRADLETPISTDRRRPGILA